MNTLPKAQGDLAPVADATWWERRWRLESAAAKLAALAAIVVLAVIVAVAALRSRFNDGIPELTEEAIAAAERLWESEGPESYRLRVRIEGRRPGDVECTVTNGEVTAMTRDGRTPSQRRTWDYWTVPAQFDTIRQDMESAADPRGGFGAPPGSKAILRAEFDPHFGYPKRYRRHVLGTPLDVEWEIVEFEELP